MEGYEEPSFSFYMKSKGMCLNGFIGLRLLAVIVNENQKLYYMSAHIVDAIVLG